MRIIVPLSWVLLVGCAGASSTATTPSATSTQPPVQSEANRDLDRDGIIAALDACPEQPEDCDGFEDTDGCPEPDNDKDHVVDSCDKCPNEPEVYNGQDDEDGCPDHALVVVGKTSAAAPVQVNSALIRIMPRVVFSRNSAQLAQRNLPELQVIADVLRNNPQLTLVGLAGHASTDERRPDTIAMQRAEAARQQLVRLGIDPSRLESRSLGARFPIDPAPSADARARNRRVEFVLVASTDGNYYQWNGTQYEPTPPPPQPPPRPIPTFDPNVQVDFSPACPAPPPRPNGCAAPETSAP